MTSMNYNETGLGTSRSQIKLNSEANIIKLNDSPFSLPKLYDESEDSKLQHVLASDCNLPDWPMKMHLIKLLCSHWSVFIATTLQSLLQPSRLTNKNSAKLQMQVDPLLSHLIIKSPPVRTFTGQLQEEQVIYLFNYLILQLFHSLIL